MNWSKGRIFLISKVISCLSSCRAISSLKTWAFEISSIGLSLTSCLSMETNSWFEILSFSDPLRKSEWDIFGSRARTTVSSGYISVMQYNLWYWWKSEVTFFKIQKCLDVLRNSKKSILNELMNSCLLLALSWRYLFLDVHVHPHVMRRNKALSTQMVVFSKLDRSVILWMVYFTF